MDDRHLAMLCHHERMREETFRLLVSPDIEAETKKLVREYLTAVDSALEGVRRDETRIKEAFGHGAEALEVLGEDLAAEAAKKRFVA